MKIRKFFVLCATIILTVCISSLISTSTSAASNKYYIKVNKGTNVVTIYKSNGTPYKSMICSTGTATPTGTYYTPAKYRWRTLMGPSYGQYSTRVVNGILFHSVWYYTNGNKSTMSVKEYNKLGTTCSHGCIRLMVKDSKWIYDNCPLGTKVIIFNGTSSDDPLGKPKLSKINTGTKMSWDPTDPDSSNPWRSKKPTITVNKTKVSIKSTFKIKNYITVKDSLGNKITSGITMTGKVNTSKVGSYTVKVKVKDWLGHTTTKKITFKVVDDKKPTISGAKNRSALAMNNTYNLLSGVTAKSAAGKSLTSKIKVTVKNSSGSSVKVTNGKVKFTKAGTYKVTYKVTGTNKKTATKTVTYKVINKQVKLSVKSSVTLEYGSSYNAYDYVTSLKSYKGAALNIKKNVTYKSTVKKTTLGTYKITYTATQSSKSYTKVTKTTTVKVVNKKAPVISGVPTSNITLNVGDSYELKSGITAAAYTGTSLTKYLVVYVNGTATTDTYLDTSEPGTYVVEYSVTIPGGKTTTKSFSITVNSKLDEEVMEAAVTELTEYYNDINPSDYTTENYKAVTAYYNEALALLEAAVSNDSIAQIVADCKANIEAVPTISYGPLV